MATHFSIPALRIPMDKGTWGATVHGFAESDTTEELRTAQHSTYSIYIESHVQLFATLWTAACQASLSVTNSWSLLKLMSIT